MDALALLLLLAFLAWHARRLWAEGRARRRARAGALDLARPLLSDALQRTEPDGFPRLAGTHRGARVDLRLVPDTLTTRKLPALWLLATLTEPQPLGATWHLMRRPRGTETFSAFDRLPRLLPPDPGLPPDTAVRTDAPPGAPTPPALAAALGALGADRLKELVLSPRGLRATWLLEEAHRGRYLLFRDAEMGRAPVPAETVQALLDALLELRDALAEAPGRRRA